MKVLALVSGGKDGCYAMLKCKEHGHEIRAIANLHPPKDRESEEMDSFMFQTVGYQIVKAISECMGVPLISKTIRGHAVTQELDYAECTNGDEVEDLYELVRAAKSQWPDIQAVSSGAVLSTYQRLRVENVCQRLGLTSLSYLWQRDQQELVEEMVAAELQAIVVKIASMGLKPTFLGKTISQLLPTFERLNSEFGFHVCGEGGEYESLTLGCPKLFQDDTYIVLDDTKLIMHEDAAFAPVAYLSISSFHIMNGGKVKDTYEQVEVNVDTLNNQQQGIVANNQQQDIVADNQQQDIVADNSFHDENGSESNSLICDIVTNIHQVNGHNGYTVASTYCTPGQSEISAAEQVRMALRALSTKLKEKPFESDICDIIYVHLFVADLNDFGDINTEYCKFFGNRPPSRSCVQVESLPEGCLVCLDVTVLRNSWKSTGRRHVLHVASISEWAPVCIGPYSQCNVVDGLAYTAGQIALDPASMVIRAVAHEDQLKLCFRHCHRILECVGSSLSHCASLIVYCESLGEDEESMTLDMKQVNSLVETVLQSEGYFTAENLPLFTVVAMPRLPRDALIEVEVVGYLKTVPVSQFDEHSNKIVNSEDDCEREEDDETDDLKKETVMVQRKCGKHFWRSITLNQISAQNASELMDLLNDMQIWSKIAMLHVFFVSTHNSHDELEIVVKEGAKHEVVIQLVAVSALGQGQYFSVVGRPIAGLC